MPKEIESVCPATRGASLLVTYDTINFSGSCGVGKLEHIRHYK
jgi:hypothetical protein